MSSIAQLIKAQLLKEDLTMGELVLRTGLDHRTVKTHLELNATVDEDGVWCDLYAWYSSIIDGKPVRVWFLTGKERL